MGSLSLLPLPMPRLHSKSPLPRRNLPRRPQSLPEANHLPAAPRRLPDLLRRGAVRMICSAEITRTGRKVRPRLRRHRKPSLIPRRAIGDIYRQRESRGSAVHVDVRPINGSLKQRRRGRRLERCRGCRKRRYRARKPTENSSGPSSKPVRTGGPARGFRLSRHSGCFESTTGNLDRKGGKGFVRSERWLDHVNRLAAGDARCQHARRDCARGEDGTLQRWTDANIWQYEDIDCGSNRYWQHQSEWRPLG